LNPQESKRRRVVVTGLGVICPAGASPDALWQGVTAGRSFVRNIQRFDTSEMPVHSGGEIDLAILQAAIPGNALQREDLTVLLADYAAGQALADAGLAEAARNGLPVGLLLGTGMGPCHTAEDSYHQYEVRGWKGLRPTTVPRTMFNVVAGEVSMRRHLTGGHCVLAAACASGSIAVAQAYSAVLSGVEDVCLTGGADSPITLSMYGAWINLRVLAKDPDPAKACKPFDKRRDGLVLAEGAGALVLEELEHARARNARIYAEMIGVGLTSDAAHITKPEVAGQAAALERCLRAAGLATGDVDYINAHGTATLLNDVTETQAIKRVLGDHARRVPISSTKSILGHSMGASGAIELITTVLALNHQVAPPTVNLESPDPECDLDYVPNAARAARMRVALKNSFAFGGANAVLALRTFEG
jgi:3-oxoacyl-[acyl-carrier-protein] synthase II